MYRYLQMIFPSKKRKEISNGATDKKHEKNILEDDLSNLFIPFSFLYLMMTINDQTDISTDMHA